MSATVTERVRADAACVMAQAADVFIEKDALAAYARRLVATSDLVTELDGDNHFVAADAPVTTAAYVLALDSINFGSGAFHIAQRDGIDLEYHVVSQGLKRAVANGQLAMPHDWARATPQQCHDVFAIPAGVHPALDTLMAQFSEHLQQTASGVTRDFGSVEALLADYRGRGAELLEIVARWPHFADVTSYHGAPVAIYKRAQILLADLELALARAGETYFGGLAALTCFADNMVPHVLRADGVLRYSEDLAARIDAGEMLAAGSTQETELRCAAIHTVELLRDSLDGAYTSVNLDHMLWHRGYLPGFTMLTPHRTLSTWY